MPKPDERDLEIIKLTEKVNGLRRDMKEIKGKLDTLYSDREILEDIQGRLAGLEEQWRMTRQHDNEVRKDIKADMQTVKTEVVDKVDEIGQAIDKKKTVVIKKPWWNKILGGEKL